MTGRRGAGRYVVSAAPIIAVVFLLAIASTAAHGKRRTPVHRPGAPVTARPTPTRGVPVATTRPTPTRSAPAGVRSGPTGGIPAPSPGAGPRPPSGVHPPAGATSAARDDMRSELNLCRLAGWTNCATLGNHYLAATGTPATISMGQLLSQVTGARTGLRNALRADATAAVASAGGMAATATRDVPFDTRWQPYTATSGDWYYAVHGFSGRLVGDVWIGPASASGDRPVQVRYRSFMYDVYDFPATGAFSQFRQLHDQGFAAEFLVTGASTTVYVPGTVRTLATRALPLRW